MAQVQHLQDIYSILHEKHTPNVDNLHLSFIDHSKHGSVVYLQPKGMAVQPASAREVLDAVLCVLAALKARSF